MARGYSPFSWGARDRGSDKKCRICGAAKANEHSLREAAHCDWMRRPKEERERILAERNNSEVAKVLREDAA
jgi:hypothetical protein